VDATESLLQRLERSDAARAARLDLRLGKRSQDDGRRHQLDGLGQCLNKGQVAVVGAAREHLAIGELPDIGDQLIDENDAGGEALEQRTEDFLARRGARGVGVSHEREPFLAAELPSELAPERSNASAGVGPRLPGGMRGPVEHGHVRLRHVHEASLVEKARNTGEVLERTAS